MIGTFKWAETHQAAVYTNWMPHQPDNAGGEDCVFKSLRVSGSGSGGKIGWNDYSCDGNSYYEIGIYALCMMKQ